MSLTPDGHRYNPRHPESIDECWIQPSMFPNLVKYSADIAKSPYLNDTIITACAMADDLCNRYFLQQQQDEIFVNQILTNNQYQTFVLSNIPVASIDKVWSQIVSTFNEISRTYIQLLDKQGIVKILPTFSTTSSVPYPHYINESANNIWIRYTAGYEVDYSESNTTNEVPYDIRLATALLVDYLYASFEVPSGIDSFSTQTYSQKNSSAESDAILSRVNNLLEKYKLSNVK